MNQRDDSPFWSVMIPTYRPEARHLERALASVLRQDPGRGEMQISVIDDASTDVDVGSIVTAVGGKRVTCERSETNRGLAGNWNRCIESACGAWVHILHQDDYVMPGFYDRVRRAASEHPEARLIATRSFFVDDDGVVLGVTPRIASLEAGGSSVIDFYYENPVQCPGVVVRRDFYERNGGFRSDLTYALDMEMWSRVIGQCGGVVLPDVLAAFRFSGNGQSSRLFRSGDAFEDRARLAVIFASRYPDFDLRRAQRRICWDALDRARRLRQMGDADGATKSRAYWKKHASIKQKCWNLAGGLSRRVLT